MQLGLDEEDAIQELLYDLVLVFIVRCFQCLEFLIRLLVYRLLVCLSDASVLLFKSFDLGILLLLVRFELLGRFTAGVFELLSAI